MALNYFVSGTGKTSHFDRSAVFVVITKVGTNATGRLCTVTGALHL